ncbi:MAG: YceI family protein [Rhodanobacteraceae bacterium]|nr:YceI family protein [Rhodanobacteraceae bacterium]MBP9154907.1 YceI family protein [Xanthomonadales bacterium]HQW82486.1 YceI family protein [Pseudomonadota bacterium]
MILRILGFIALLVSSPAFAADYVVRTGTLTFSGQQQGEAFDGRFDRFSATIQFDAAQLTESKLDVSIDLSSADSQNSERDDTLKGDDFFAIERFPKAHFVTSVVRAIDATQFEADATLTIRDKSVALKFPFTFERDANGARLKARVTLDRLAFDIGAGDWADDGMIGHSVEVNVDLNLIAKP